VTEPAARAWRVLLRHELTLLWWFRVTPGGRRLSRFVAPFISNHPFVDISVVTWAAYAGVVWKWGLRPFYCGALNLVAAFALRGLLALPRPCEYDPPTAGAAAAASRASSRTWRSSCTACARSACRATSRAARGSPRSRRARSSA
jgi:hypothetical protein